MDNNVKPPLGARPYYISASLRISELGLAIHENPNDDNISNIKAWANEILLQCRLIEDMKLNLHGIILSPNTSKSDDAY